MAKIIIGLMVKGDFFLKGSSMEEQSRKGACPLSKRANCSRKGLTIWLKFQRVANDTVFQFKKVVAQKSPVF